MRTIGGEQAAEAGQAGALALTAARRRRRPAPYLLNLPVVVLLLGLVAYPTLSALWQSLHDADLQTVTGGGNWVGLDNYRKLFAGSEFWHSLRITLIFVIGSVILSVGGGVLLALAANLRVPGRAILRALLVVPWAVPPVINGMMWGWIFNGQVGIFNAVLKALGIIDHYHTWLGEGTQALAIVTLAQSWNMMSLTAIFVLAALQSVPPDLHEAAEVDGARALQRFWHVTMPWLKQPLVIVVLLQTVLALRLFDLVYVLTGGGPGNATSVLAWQAYEEAFTNLNFGVANAYSYLIALIGLIFAGVYLVILFRMRGVDES